IPFGDDNKKCNDNGEESKGKKRKGRKKSRCPLFGGGGDGGGGFCGLEFGDAIDHVAYGFDGAEGFVGDVDVEGFFDLERDVDLVERVNIELLEGAGERDGIGGN